MDKLIMFHINPSTTGLILIGASHFPKYQDHDRKSFSNAHKKMKEYFLKSREGLDLAPDNVLDLFDSDLLAGTQIEEAEKWIQSHKLFRDIFIYIATHGDYVEETNCFFLKVKASTDEIDGRSIREDTHIKFETLYNQTFGTGNVRMYFIIDACRSGAVHMSHPDRVYISRSLHRSQEWNDPRQRRSAAFLTADSHDELGPVDGPHDKYMLPLFTECLLEILQQGIKGGFSYGLSLDTLRYAINMRIRAKADERSDPESPKDPSFAQISDRSPSGPADGEPRLSGVPVFPNNDPANVRINFAAHRIRLAFSNADREKVERSKVEVRNSALEADKEQLETENQKLESEKEDLTKELGASIRNVRDLTKDNTKNEETNRKNEEMIELLKRTNWRLYWLLIFIVSSPLAGCALVLYFEPNLWKLLVSGLETALTPK